jgi:hypothetical protein
LVVVRPLLACAELLPASLSLGIARRPELLPEAIALNRINE